MPKQYARKYLEAIIKHGERTAETESPFLKTYFVQGEITGLIKIGKTIGTLDDRLKLLQASSPDMLTVLKIIPRNIEIECHTIFAQYRLHGEWFQPHPELLVYIAALPINH